MCSSGKALNVRTVRPNGKVLHTRGLIRLETNNAHSQVVWGKHTSFTLESSLDELETTAVWTSPWGKHRPFTWTRIWRDYSESVSWNSRSEAQWTDDAAKERDEAWPSWEDVSKEEVSNLEEAWPAWEEVAASLGANDV